jgi:sugar O-acyltransferase (sialic acid O-acetyltransferase NeuD family)
MNPVAILRGGGRQGAVVYEQIKDSHTEILLWDDSTGDSIHPLLSGLPRVNATTMGVFALSTQEEMPCYVAVGSGKIRKKLVEALKETFQKEQDNSCCPRLAFPSIIHKTAVVSPSATIGSGCFVGPFALVNTNAHIGDFCIVNSSVLVEHDCVLDEYVTLNPGAILLGSVKVATLVTAGANSTVRDDRSVAAGAMIGMGAAVVRDINGPLHGFWGGLPARPVFQPMAADNGDKTIRWCVKKPFSSNRVLQYLQTSLEKGHLTNDGPLQPVIAAKIKAMVRSTRQPLMTCNGTGALHAIAAGLALKENKLLRWVTQAFTFPSAIQGPLSDSIVCDIDPVLKGPSMEFLESSKDLFDGVIVTNIFGVSAWMDVLLSIAVRLIAPHLQLLLFFVFANVVPG